MGIPKGSGIRLTICKIEKLIFNCDIKNKNYFQMDYPLTLPTHLLITGFILAMLTLIFIFWFGIPALKQRHQLR
jgi:hypothetical protein